jgi:carotenoid cleavage dioxygenase
MHWNRICIASAKIGKSVGQRLDDRLLEFGTFNQIVAGNRYRNCYSVKIEHGMFLFTGFVKHDLVIGKSWEAKLPEIVYASESPVAPRISAVNEDNFYLVDL